MRSGLRIASGPILTQAGNWLALLAIAGQMSAAEGGIFRIAVQVCMLMQLINGSFATMAGPHLARAANAGDTRQLRRTILTAGGIGIALSAPLGLMALLAPAWIMGLFGPEFASGAVALQWLTIGQLVNVAAGPVGGAGDDSGGLRQPHADCADCAAAAALGACRRRLCDLRRLARAQRGELAVLLVRCAPPA
jgi:O-antigen/teichoic acid export membrane protein